MAQKENKGGILKNDQIEEDLNAKVKLPESANAYRGAQDNGDSMVRPLGNAVQRADGRPPDEIGEE